MKNNRVLLAFTALLLVGLACASIGGGNGNETAPSNNSINENQSSTATFTPAAQSDATESQTTEELPPISFDDLLLAGIESGKWTEGEGLVLFLQYIVGEITESEIEDVSDVVGKSGTGLVRMAGDYLNKPDADPTQKQEIERLIRMLFPPQDVLDAISAQALAPSSSKTSAQPPAVDSQNQQACMDFAGTGYDGAIDLGVTCYYYEEMDLDGRVFRVYYPEWMEGNEAMETVIGYTMDALGEAAILYLSFPDLIVRDVNLVFSIIPDQNGNALGEQYYFDVSDEACPLTMYPESTRTTVQRYKQIVAHEMFHCVQDWSFPNTSPYGTHSWWLEGTADYYSNLVYPSANLEWDFLPDFDNSSRNTPIFDMTYENFVFFQFMGNKYSPEVLIDILMRISAAGGRAAQESTLAGVSGFDENFNRFVVEYLSTGIPDSGGGAITTSPARVTGTKTVSEKGEVEFTVQPFVAMRYYVDYVKEKRFLQTPINTEGTQFSSVEFKLHQSFTAWSDLPPEIRSECDDKVRYIFAPTTTKDGYSNYTANVTLAEKAECDPCLLGTWDIDKESYKAFMERIMAEADTQGMTIDLAFGGHQYLQFETDGKVLTQRDEFSITINDQITTIINGHGQGNYSTTDGEKLTVSGFVDSTEDVSMSVAGGQITYSSESATFSFFGTNYSDPNLAMNLNEDSGPQSHSIEYVCEQDTLSMTIQGYEQYGEVVFNRVDKILPTAVPTSAPADQP